MTPRKVLEVLRAEFSAETPDVLELDTVLGSVPATGGWEPVWDYVAARAADVFDAPSSHAWVALWMCSEHAPERLEPFSSSRILAAGSAAPWLTVMGACGSLCKAGRIRGEELGVAVVRHKEFAGVESRSTRDVVLRTCLIALAANFVEEDLTAAGRFLAAVRGAPAWSPPSWGETGVPLYVRSALFRSLHGLLEAEGDAWLVDRTEGGRVLDRLASHGPLGRYASDAAASAACAVIGHDWPRSRRDRSALRFDLLGRQGLQRLVRARSFGAASVQQQDASEGILVALTAAEALAKLGYTERARDLGHRVESQASRLSGGRPYAAWAQRVGV